ncbi:ornithine cyclodeaminase [Alteribacter natronophilus]|uniref:ornithine cyclodeaminase n=1 Tax=Alteribacter natronophilus TaxID=2583810 RepID=UPI00110EBE1F|nr:ornithine cyclodeaminase [Alteribacter natronophilus]TMW71177.1 ornithine cyclodeaminase [Alteribacter natronophilus]
MGIISKIKSIFNPPTEQAKETSPALKEKFQQTKMSQNQCYVSVRKPRHKKIEIIPITMEEKKEWSSFFSVEKENPTLPGFENRSRRKFRHLFHNENIIITEAAGSIEIVSKDIIKQFTLKDTKLEKMTPITTTEQGIILQNKGTVAFINFLSQEAYLFEFDWMPFSFAMGEDYWLVGTRETYDGPGELYCFEINGTQRWGVAFKESMASMFGEVKFTSYLLSVCKETNDIFAGSMDRIYRIDPQNTSLKTRIAISELKKKDLQKKYAELERSLSVPPKTEDEAISQFATKLAAQFSIGFEKASVNSPFVGFTHDPKTGYLFLMEREGRVSAWDKKGNLLWINTFKNEGRFITWLDDKLIISFVEGETFWLNDDGKFIFGAKLPKEASTIDLIPSSDSYLIVSQDNRLYELQKETGKLIKGSEGHPGMSLFVVSNHSIFFDGKGNGQGYFWLAPENHQWKHFEARTIEDIEEFDVQSGVAPEIAATTPFKKSWELKSEDKWFGNRLVDPKNDLIYVVEKAPEKSIEERAKLTDAQRRKEFSSHYLVCYDTNKQELWREHIYSSMWSLFLSPDGEYIFTSKPKKDEITYEPGDILVYSKDGTLLHKFKSKSQGFQLEFLSNDKAYVRFTVDRGEKPFNGYFERNQKGKWTLVFDETGQEKLNKPFGAGLNEIKTNNFELVRTDKKIYSLSSDEKTEELKLQAAIYEAVESENKDFAMRIGTRIVQIFNSHLEKKLELKEEENIQSITLSSNRIIILTKKEIRGYSYNGELLWRYSTIPKVNTTGVYWSPADNKVLWVASSNLETIVATLSEEGKVINSQSFNKESYHRPIEAFPNESCFVAHTNEKLTGYKL